MSSLLKSRIYAYLGESGETDGLIDECLEELASTARFRYAYKTFAEPPEFLRREPYSKFLEGTRGVILSVMTLGRETDKRIGVLARTDMAKSVVYDACASAYLEQLADEYEERFGEDRTYRFCPGYGGSDIKDVKYIIELVKPEATGVTLTESGYMLPLKSMAGIIGIGKKTEKTCAGCAQLAHCNYRQEGKRCYGSENK